MKKTIKCKTCKIEFKPFRRNEIIVSRLCPECRKEKLRISNAKQAKRNLLVRKKATKKRKKEKKANSPSVLTKKLDAVFSQYIRKVASDKLGMVRCVCCGKVMHWKDSQNAHYVGRASRSTRWDERNCHPNCYGCNVCKSGNYPAYTEFLLNTYGVEWLKELIDDGNKIKKWTAQDLKAMIEEYENKFNSLV